MKKLFQIGAGRIGRSFIAQIFSKGGYSIVFADIDPCIVDALNEAACYTIIFKKNEEIETYTVKNVSAIEIISRKKVVKNIIEADIISISVGKKSLLNLARVLAEGINERYLLRKKSPIDIILAENVRNAAALLSNEMGKFLSNVPMEDYVGFVETSIGKMVPSMTPEQLEEDPLAVFTEPYNNLIVDKAGFRNKLPEVPDLFPKENMKAWVDRKIFIHNLGHAILAYQCNYSFPEVIYTWEALEIEKIFDITRKTMIQSAEILQAMYPSEFSTENLVEHIDDLMTRFANKALNDTIFRVGCDLARKLGRDDRLMVPIMNAIEYGKEYDLILEAWVKGCYFNASNENGRYLNEDKKFKIKYRENPIWILSAHCIFDSSKDAVLFRKVEELMIKIALYE
jgi:mannitol-1-phosphate 5-dehydrogenase